MTGVRNSAVRAVRLRRSGAWLGMFALLFQAVLPMSGMPMSRGVAGLSGNYSSICDIGAPQQEDPARRSGEGGSGDIPPCPVCQVLQQFGTYLPPTDAAAAVLAQKSVAGETPREPVLSPNPVISYCRVRAPPLSA